MIKIDRMKKTFLINFFEVTEENTVDVLYLKIELGHFNFFFVFIYVCGCFANVSSVHHVYAVHGDLKGQKRKSDYWELELKLSATQVLGTEPMFSGRKSSQYSKPEYLCSPFPSSLKV